MFTAALFKIAKTWKQRKCPSTDKEDVYTCRHIHTMECYSATKENEIMPFAAARVKIEIIILSQTVKDKYMISLICEILKNDLN